MQIAALIELLKAAEAPSPELDFWITVRVWDPCNYSDAELQADIDAVGIEGMYIEKPFTSSIDAAISLADCILPSANCWGIDKDERGIEAHVQLNGVKDGHWAQFAKHKTEPAIALCIAIIKAMQASANPTPAPRETTK